jgi:Flp pilus assembly pilin Flp
MYQTIVSSMTTVLRNRKGVSATEYTLMVVGIAALVLGAAQALGGDISSALTSIGNYLTTAAAAL